MGSRRMHREADRRTDTLPWSNTDMKWEHRLTIGPLEVAVLIAERGERQFDRWRAKDVVKRFIGRSARRVTESPAARDRIDNEASAILTKIAGVEWYHSIDLGHGVVTP